METPPAIVAGDKLRDESVTGFTVRLAVLATPEEVAVIVTTVLAVTFAVVIVNAGEYLWPAATVTVAGGAATPGLELLRDTTTPDGPAAAFKITWLDVVDPPPPTVAGDRFNIDRAGASTVNVAVLVTPA